jgi:hypothetical protein
MSPIDFFCTYDPSLGLYRLLVASRCFTLTGEVFERARRELREAAWNTSLTRSLVLDHGGQRLTLDGATRHDLLAILGILDAADRGARIVGQAWAN